MMTVLPPPVARVKLAFDQLTAADQALFEEAVMNDRLTQEAVPWPEAELRRRIERIDQGLDRLIPLEEARSSLKARLASR